MRILYALYNFNGLTGSELYYYELAKEMVRLGHNVKIVANICDNEIKEKANNAGINCYSMEYLNHLIGCSDIIHASHKPIVEEILNYDFNIPLVVTSHSEVLDIEKIKDHKRISHFIGIRRSIYRLLPNEKRSFIPNPVDHTRFNKIGTNGLFNEKIIFFPGTINHLRIDVLKDLINRYSGTHEIVCMDNGNFPKLNGVTYLDPTWNIEDIMKRCEIVVGIIMGRTYIEASLCGKKYIDYAINDSGLIANINAYDPNEYYIGFPGSVKISDFYSINVARKIHDLYLKLLN